MILLIGLPISMIITPLQPLSSGYTRHLADMRRSSLSCHLISLLSRLSTTNLLEDEDEELYILRDPNGNESCCELSFSFRGFEVKTVKLVLGYLRADNLRKECEYVSVLYFISFKLNMVFQF
jgi:hypothetical protein